MAKEETVLSLEGKFLRGVRLAESGGSFSRPVAETWSLAQDAQESVPPKPVAEPKPEQPKKDK